VLDGEGQFLQALGAIRFMGQVNKMPQAIVVGIPNTDRNRDLLPPTASSQDTARLPGGGGADKFLAFLTDELRPQIEGNYRTWPFSILFGHSAGGLFAVHTFLNSPAAFSAHIASSPALWWDDYGEARSAETTLASEPGRRGFLFLSRGREHECQTEGIARLVKVLQDRNNPDLEWELKVFADERHETAPICIEDDCRLGRAGAVRWPRETEPCGRIPGRGLRGSLPNRTWEAGDETPSRFLVAALRSCRVLWLRGG